MRKAWVLAAGAAIVMATIGVSAMSPDPARQPGGYEVASAEDSRTVVQARVPAAPRHDVREPMPGTLPLLLVGSLLLGLGAAVRRTT